MKFSDLVEMGFNQGLEWGHGQALATRNNKVEACLLGAAFVGAYGLDKALDAIGYDPYADLPYHFADILSGVEEMSVKIYHINDSEATSKEEAIQALKNSEWDFDVVDTSLENIDIGQLVSLD